MPPQSEPPCAKANPPGKGLPWRDGILIVVVIVGALTCAALLLFLVPTLLVHHEDYPSPRAYTDALNASRSPLGVFSAAVLAGAAALIGVIVSNHNARLTRENNAVARANSESTRESLKVTREALESTERRDEKARAQDRIKADDDQFAKAVEMLGSPAVAVRAGALHVLYRLAISAPERTQPVVDVFCSYLRQPFHHPDLDHDPKSAELPAVPERAWWPQDEAEREARDGEHEVRRTAWRLIDALLPGAGSGQETPAGLHLDLTAAVLDGLTLEDKVVTTLRLERAYLAEDLLLTGTHVTGDILLGGTHIAGQVRMIGGTRIAQDVRVGAGAHVTGGISVGGTDWYSSPRSHEGAEMYSLRIENAHVGWVIIRAGAKIHNVVVIDETRVERAVWVTEGAVIGSNFMLRTGTTVGSVLVDNATIGGGLSLEGPDLQIAGAVRVDRAEIGSLYIAARSIGGDVEVFHGNDRKRVAGRQEDRR